MSRARRIRIASLLAVGTLASGTFALAPAAFATESTEPTPDELIASVVPGAVSDAASIPEAEDGYFELESGSNSSLESQFRSFSDASVETVPQETTTVRIPDSADSPLQLTSEAGTASIDLPGTSDATASEVLVSYDAGPIDIAVVPQSEGSVQIFSIHNDASTPRVDYPLNLPTDTSVQVNEDGSVGGYRNGELLFFVGAPFANDSLGAQVPTHYEYSHGVLTQVLELTSSDIVFPVVADPWMGKALYTNVNVTTYSSSSAHPGAWKVNATPTSAGANYRGRDTWNAHRDEIKSKINTNRWKATLEGQLWCHIAGYPASLPEYNLESWRANWGYAEQTPWGCNYPEGGWGSAS